MISFKSSDYLYSYNTPRTQKFKMHLHHYYEFLYFINGYATYMVENNTYEANPGDLFITRPNELHAIVLHSGAEYERKFFQISSNFLSDLEIDLFAYINNRPLGEFNRINSTLVKEYKLAQYFDGIEEYVVNREAESDIMVKTYAIQFLVKLNRILSQDLGEFELKRKSNPKIDTIIEYINNNLNEPIMLDDLANMVYVNKYHVCHLFKEYTGLSVKEYISAKRIAKAKSLISSGMDFTTVCFHCGFNDYSSFYKTFKKFTGTSPRKFLK